MAGDPESKTGDGGGGCGGRGGCHLVMGGAGDGEGEHDPKSGKPTDGKLNLVGTPGLTCGGGSWAGGLEGWAEAGRGKGGPLSCEEAGGKNR